VIDYYHACEYIYKMADALFPGPKEAHAWARKMCRWLKTKPKGIHRVLHSAAAIRGRSIVVRAKLKQYRTAYNYLRKRIGFLDYYQYRRDHLPSSRSHPGGCQIGMRRLSSSHGSDASAPRTVMEDGIP
jgi:hypothetical protein